MEEIRTLAGKSIVDDQVANGLAKRSEEDLFVLREKLYLNAHAVQKIDDALEIKSHVNPRN